MGIWFLPHTSAIFNPIIMKLHIRVHETTSGYVSVIWRNWAKWDQIWAWLYHGLWWAVGVRDPLKCLIIDPSLVVNCYLETCFTKNQAGPPPPLILIKI